MSALRTVKQPPTKRRHPAVKLASGEKHINSINPTRPHCPKLFSIRACIIDDEKLRSSGAIPHVEDAAALRQRVDVRNGETEKQLAATPNPAKDQGAASIAKDMPVYCRLLPVYAQILGMAGVRRK
jgi:hypothetical protein